MKIAVIGGGPARRNLKNINTKLVFSIFFIKG